MNRIERNALVVENLPLVGYLVSELCGRATHLSRDDLASVGAIALITSAESFDPTLGIPFGAYARRRIVGAFADDMRSADWAPRSARKRIKETLAVQETLTTALGRTPDVDEIANAMGIDRETARAALSDAGRSVTSLDDTVADSLAAEIVSPEENLLMGEELRYLRASVDALSERMRAIIVAVYFEDRTVTEIAAELGITHSAVSQQRSEAIRLLRDGLGTHYSDGDEPHVPVSRVATASRSAYLARVAEQAVLEVSRRAALRGRVSTVS